MLKTSEVFGIRTKVSEHSYIDRGRLDSEIKNLSDQDQHIALRGESKSGKSWLRQKVFQNSNIVQCRIDYKTIDIYRQILSNLDISIIINRTNEYSATIDFEAKTDIGWSWLASASGGISGSGVGKFTSVRKHIGRDEFDFDFLSHIIKDSGRRVIIEDFHYLASDVQEKLAHELKSLWDFGVYFVVIGVWHRKNFVTSLNPDLAGRITEVEVSWTSEELVESVLKGALALNVDLDRRVAKRLADDSYTNIGILQSIASIYFDKIGVRERQNSLISVCKTSEVDDAGMAYAEQIEAIYSSFAENVSDGIRKRKDATQIYAFALWAIMESDDKSIIQGLTVDQIFDVANKRQPRIQKPNLRSVLQNIKKLQVDSRGNRLVLVFDESTDSVILVDKGMLFYRKYSTSKWPWERIALESQHAEKYSTQSPGKT